MHTLLLHAHLPPNFWVEALHIVIHPLNLTPFIFINNEILYTKLFQKPPTYTHLQVFGCSCYPHIPKPYKLAPRSTPCIFIRYPSNHRGYRCCDLATRKIIISHYVIFYELSFPFRFMTPNQASSFSFLDNFVAQSPRSHEFLTSSIPTTQDVTTPPPSPLGPSNTTHNPPSPLGSPIPPPEPLRNPSSPI